MERKKEIILLRIGLITAVIPCRSAQCLIMYRGMPGLSSTEGCNFINESLMNSFNQIHCPFMVIKSK